LLLHAKDDDVIPHHHSSTLFAGLHERCETTSGIRSDVEVVEYKGWGTVFSFPRSYTKSCGGDAVESGEVVWWDGVMGGHNDIGWSEGTVDLIRRIARL
jgi:abhydrolase domain-containing protein 12